MRKKAKRTYTVPQLEQFDCKVERGFAGSNGSETPSNGFGATRSGYGTSPNGAEGGYLWN